MKDILEVSKEATSLIRSKYSSFDKALFTESELKDIVQIVQETYLRQSFFWRIRHSFKEYGNMVMLDMQYNFIGGSALNKNADTTILVN